MKIFILLLGNIKRKIFHKYILDKYSIKYYNHPFNYIYNNNYILERRYFTLIYMSIMCVYELFDLLDNFLYTFNDKWMLYNVYGTRDNNRNNLSSLCSILSISDSDIKHLGRYECMKILLQQNHDESSLIQSLTLLNKTDDERIIKLYINHINTKTNIDSNIIKN